MMIIIIIIIIIIILIIITVQVIHIVVGSLGSVTKNVDKWLEKLDMRISGTGRVLRKVLEL